MTAKKNKTAQIMVRVDEHLKRQLTREAEMDKRTLSNYIIKLLETHPDRKGTK